MFGRAIWDKLSESNFKTFKNHEGDLCQSDYWLITWHQQTLCITINIFWQWAITNQRAGNYKTAGSYKITPLTLQHQWQSIMLL